MITCGLERYSQFETKVVIGDNCKPKDLFTIYKQKLKLKSNLISCLKFNVCVVITTNPSRIQIENLNVCFTRVLVLDSVLH